MHEKNERQIKIALKSGERGGGEKRTGSSARIVLPAAMNYNGGDERPGNPAEERKRTMKILMLGNSFTSSNGLPERLAERTGAEVIAHTRGGARLSEQLNPATRLGRATAAALEGERFDYVVLQEMSHGPVTAPERYRDSVKGLCARIRQNGALPVLYATWAYRSGDRFYEKTGLNQQEMFRELHRVCTLAAEENGALIAPVGEALRTRLPEEERYAPDGRHPSPAATEIAAEVLAAALK